MAELVRSSEVKERYEVKEGAQGVVYKTLYGRDNSDRLLSATLINLEPGGKTKNHNHKPHHVHYVISGKGLLVCGDEGKEISISAGDATYITAWEQHYFKNNGNEHLLLLAVRGPLEKE